MSVYVLPGACGLLLGLLLRWSGLHCPDGLRNALALRRSWTLRTALYALGAAMALTALLCWLAVIDVDGIQVLPLTAGAVVGGVVFGVAAGLGGYTPLTALAGLGSGRLMTAACTLAGCAAGTALLPVAEGAFASLRAMGPISETTLFRMTLDEPFLLDGGFLGQACAGLLLISIAICIPSPREPLPDATEPTPDVTTAENVTESAPEPPVEEPAPEPEEAPADTFVALLPGEEPLVVDTGADASEGTEKVQDNVTQK